MHVDVHLSFFMCHKIVAQLYENGKENWFTNKSKYLQWLILLHFPEQSISQKMGKCIERSSCVSSRNLQTMNADFKAVLEFDSLLAGADNMISLSSPKMKVKNVLLPKLLLLSQFHFWSLVLCNIGSGLAKSSWGSIFPINSISLCLCYLGAVR